MVSVPMPQPISRTFLPRQRSNWAKPGMWYSTKYLRASTSSKYCLVPTGAWEWRKLQGRRSQYSFTLSTAMSSNDMLFLVSEFSDAVLGGKEKPMQAQLWHVFGLAI